jgi:hypothetical protein
LNTPVKLNAAITQDAYAKPQRDLPKLSCPPQSGFIYATRDLTVKTLRSRDLGSRAKYGEQHLGP